MINHKKKYTTYGHVNSKGVLSIYNRSQLNKSLKEHFNGTSIELVITEKVYEFSDKMRNYYFAVVVKEVQKAWNYTGIVKTLKTIDSELRSMFLCKEFYNEDLGKWEFENHTLRKGETEVTQKMMSDFIEKVIIWSIQNLNWAIPYPSEQLTQEDLTEHQRQALNKGVNSKSSF